MLLSTIVHKITRQHWLLIVVFLASCTTPSKPDTVAIISPSSTDSRETLLEQATFARQLEPFERNQQLLTIAQKLLAINEVDSARQVIESVSRNKLSQTAFMAYTLTAGKIYLAAQSLGQAQIILNAPQIDDIYLNLNNQQQIELHNLRAELYTQTGNIDASLREYMALSTLLSSDTDIENNNNAIWLHLSSLTLPELDLLAVTLTDPIASAWINLATISQQSQGSIEQQNQAINLWIAEHPDHPASQFLPADLALLQTLLGNTPQNIALLLPLQGKLAKAGQTIRDGFLASYYTHQDQQGSTPTVMLYDTSKGDINTIYDTAVKNGAGIVIGPLSKIHVQQLEQRASLDVPTLALNYSETIKDIEEKPIYQFGLSLEDEAVQVADRAWAEGHRQALILLSEANWSQRTADAFTQRWQEYGGTIIRRGTLTKDVSYSDTIKDILLIEESKQRAKSLRKLFGRGFEFEPRRRDDIDMIFLISRSQEGRQIKPTLNFHYASDIPVYATSQIYTQSNDENKNIDLNDIRLTTMPWIMDDSIKEKTLIKQSIKVNPSYERLYALGVDSFLLYPRLLQLTQSQQSLYGATGQLKVSSNKRISRTQLWAEISKGKLKPLRTLILSDTDTL